MNEIGLILGFHLHLPQGMPRARWDWLHRAALRPMLDTLAATPGPRVVLHLSGATWSRLAGSEPTTLQRIRSLVGGKQLELLGGGWSGAFLGGLPDRDALSQLQLTARQLKRRVGVMPQGAWLTHGAWDPGLPRTLSRAGLSHAFLPDDAFAAAGMLPHDLDGPVLTEREGSTLTLFPLDGSLAAMIPARPVPEVIDYMRRRARADLTVTTWFGDLEELAEKTRKSGLRTWLSQLMRKLTANEHWLRTMFPNQVMQRLPPRRRVYLPTWFPPALAESALAPGDVDRLSEVQAVPAAGWEAFLARYDEANRLHKALLRVSREVQRLRAHLRKTGLDDDGKRALEKATEALCRAGSSDPLWHAQGRWMGVYDPAMRQAAWSAVVEAERACNLVLGEQHAMRCERADHNGDGRQEVLVRTPHVAAMVEPELGGALTELALWEMPGILLNTMTRRQELYHDSLLRNAMLPALVDEEPEEVITNTEDSVPPQDPGASLLIEDDDEYESGRWDLIQPGGELPLCDRLQQDRRVRTSFADHFLGAETTLENLWRGQHAEEGDFTHGAYKVLNAETQGQDVVSVHLAREGLVRQAGSKGVEERLVQVNKQYTFHRVQARIDVRYEISNRYHSPVRSTFAVELNLGLDGRVGDAVAIKLDDGRSIPVTKRGKVESIRQLALVDKARQLAVRLAVEQPATLWFYPVECVVAGRGGLETVYQGPCLLLSWPVSLWGEERVRLDLSLAVQLQR